MMSSVFFFLIHWVLLGKTDEIVGHLHIGSGFIKSYWKSPTPIAPNKFRAFSKLIKEWFYNILLYRNEVRHEVQNYKQRGWGSLLWLLRGLRDHSYSP